MKRRVVFIGGCDRGGTTMVGDHLGNVPGVVVVRTREEVERGKTVKTSLERKILEEGRVLHG